jgi:o-succinylbenzoate synthase
VFRQKDCWFIILKAGDGTRGIGEVSFIPGLSVEDPGEIEIQIDHVCKLVSRGELDPAKSLPALPGVRFALETALADIEGGGNRILYPSEFTRGISGIPTNGLIWMGDRAFMMEQVRERVKRGFRVLKMKVGALQPEVELELLAWIRKEFSSMDLEIRLDANGAFTPEEAPGRLEEFAYFGIHSIEQPIGPGQPEAMAELCRDPVIPIALDEELIGVTGKENRRGVVERIRPSYLILKPGLLGGFTEAREWIDIAEELGAGWWITSALESNIGLNAIAQWTWSMTVDRNSGKPAILHQGLGTGQLYSNNIPSPLRMDGEILWYGRGGKWDLQSILQKGERSDTA